MNNAQQWFSLIAAGVGLPLLLALIAAVRGHNQDKAKAIAERAQSEDSSAFREMELAIQSLSPLRETVDWLKAQMSDQRDEIRVLKGQAREHEREIRELKQENVALRAENVRLRADLSRYRDG